MKGATIVLLLGFCLIATVECGGEYTPCTMGAACFPNNTLPEGLTDRDGDYYCCPDRLRTIKLKHLKRKGTYRCRCRMSRNMDRDIERWAERTRHRGRMCLREEQCDSEKLRPSVIVKVKRKFKYCCFGAGVKNNRSFSLAEYLTIDRDKEEFIGCRCVHQPWPQPGPQGAVLVTPVLGYESSGEVCSYDEGCQDRPLLKCESQWPSNVTFCCYGSRGLVTENDGTNVTRCTCTDEVYGTQCAATRPATVADSTTQYITEYSTTQNASTITNIVRENSTTTDAVVIVADTAISCLSECSNRTDEDTCTDSSQDVRCCPYNMAVVASQSDEGTFTSCTCKAQVNKWCGTGTSLATPFSSGVSDIILPVLAAFLLSQI